MAGDHLSIGKHRRYSDDQGAEESSKRHKHQHQHQHEHHQRHRKAEVEDDDAFEEPEEGEIVDDVESGELKHEDDGDRDNLIKSGGDTGYKVDMKDGDSDACLQKDKLEVLNAGEKQMWFNNEIRRRESRSPKLDSEKERKQKSVVKDSSNCQEKSVSPISGESIRVIKSEKKYDNDIRDSGSNLEVLYPMRDLNLKDARRSKYDGSSPSYSRQFDEPSHRKWLKSPEHERQRSRSRDGTRGRSCEMSSMPLPDLDDRSNQVMKTDRLEKYVSRSRLSDDEYHREREGSSYSKHDDRNGSPRRHRVRERNSDDLRDKDRMKLDRRSRRESSYSRHDRHGTQDRREDRHASRDRREDRHGSQDRWDDRHESRGGRDDGQESRSRRDARHDSSNKQEGKLDGRRREIDIERYSGSSRDNYSESRDVSRNRHADKERLKDGARGSDKDGSGREHSRARNDGSYRYKDDQMERDRVSSRDRHRSARNSRYDDLEHPKEKSQAKEGTKEHFSVTGNGGGKEKSIREEDEDYQERIEQQLAQKDEDDPERIKEESRRRRQAILEKYKKPQQQHQQVESSSSNGIDKDEKALISEEKLETANKVLDNMLDLADTYGADSTFDVRKSPSENGSSDNQITNTGGLGEGTPKSERSADMFTDDIFGDSPTGVRRMDKGDAPQIDKNYLHDNWDDAEGYYSYRFGEVLDGRYEIIAAHGKGVFSTVVRAKDLKPGKGDPEEVAIKIIRSNETMYKAGQDEFVILKKLAGADPEDKRHCVRFLSCFKYRNHLCLVFESLHMNLREVLKKFGRNIGLKLTAVRAYAKQLFIALKHLRNCGVLHCDIKPDNMLVNEAKNVLKLCDFGNAMFAGKNEITPYLVSRFYRAPEIILGLPYDHPMDMWSVGCCLYELYTGKVLFPGPSNNDMLRLHMELKGPFPKKMLRKGAFVAQHFDQDLNFHAVEEDPVTKKAVNRMLINIKPKDIGNLITGSTGEDQKMLLNFKDLLDKIFVLDPEKRLTVSQALSHSFITGK